MVNDETQRVLAIALTHFAAGGVANTSIDAIASDAGVSAQQLTQRYTSVDGLFEAAIAWGTRELQPALAALADSEGMAAEQLLLMIRRLASPSSEERSALFAFYRELLDGSPRARTVFERCLKPPFEQLVGAIGSAQFRGELAPLPPRFVATLLLSGLLLPQLIGVGTVDALLQGVHARLDDDDEYDPATKPRSALLAASIEATFHGLLSERARAQLTPTRH